MGAVSAKTAWKDLYARYDHGFVVITATYLQHNMVHACPHPDHDAAVVKTAMTCLYMMTSPCAVVAALATCCVNQI